MLDGHGLGWIFLFFSGMPFADWMDRGHVYSFRDDVDTELLL
jgi:hypothetical protein